MKRKIFSTLLMGAFVIASMSMFTSCKDYDDDINANTDAIAETNSLVSTLQNQVKVLEAAASTAQSTADAATKSAADAATAAATAQKAADAAQKTGDAATAAAQTAQATAETAQAAADAAKAAAAEAQKAAIENATEQVKALKTEVETALAAKLDKSEFDAKTAEFDNKIAEIEGTISGIATSIQGINSSITDLNTELSGLQGTVTDINGKVVDLTTTLNLLGEDVKTNTSDIKTAKENIATLTAAQADAALQITALETYKNLLETETIPGLNAAIKANGVEIDGVKTSIEDIKTNIAKVQKDLEDEIATVSTNLATLKATVEGLQEAYKNADADIISKYKSADDILDGKISDLAALVAANKTEINSKVDDAVADLQSQIDNLLNVNIDGISTTIKEYKEEIIEKFKGYYTSGEIDTKIGDLNTAITTAANTAATNLTNAKNEIYNTINPKIATLHTLIASRLTSLLYAPTTYVDGIEAIRFATLQYTDWGTNASAWEADAAKSTNKSYIIDDALTEADYYVGPSGISLDDIASLDFIENTATNITATRGVAEAPIVVADKTLENGKLVLKLKKNTSASFGTSNSSFTIVALKAKLADNVLTNDEKTAGKDVNVYSDWARLYETSATPYIHNTLSVKNDGTIDETQTGKTNAKTSHFWSYKTVYNNGTKATVLPSTENANYIVKKVDYNKTLDLKSLVEVCDKSGTIYNLDTYGLEFAFNLIDYKLLNDNETTDNTNQKNFAKIDGSIISSTSRDGVANNRDAIGREPMIQVVLKDVRDPENVKVVDVRYFKIQWVAETNIQDYGQIADDFNETFSCGDQDNFTVLEENVNKLYSFANLSRDEFHNSYDLVTSLYGTKDNAQNGVSAITGTSIKDLNDWSKAGQTHNLNWSIDLSATYFKPSQAEYEAGTATRTVYGKFQSKTNSMDMIIFSMKVVYKINKMAYANGVNYSQEQWNPSGLTMDNGLTNTDKYRTVNPTLRSDAEYGSAILQDGGRNPFWPWNPLRPYWDNGYRTTQFIGDFLVGYINNGSVPASVAALVANEDNAYFKFDATRLSYIATETSTATSKWTVSTDGLTLKYNGTAAAEIANGSIRLYESNAGMEDSKPSAGALLLVGKNIPVVLASDYCGFTQTIDQYLVSFMTPLAIDDIVIDGYLQDIIEGGSSSLDVTDKVIVRETFGLKRVIDGDNDRYHIGDYVNLQTWYGVEGVDWDTEDATTNLTKNGTIGTSVNTKLSELTDANGNPKYKVDMKGYKVTFYNLYGNAIGQDIQIAIPVKVVTKWGTLSKNVIFTVKKGI